MKLQIEHCCSSILDAPCLSFDILKDNEGENRNTFPHACFIVAGTQADANSINNIIVMQLSNLKRTYKVVNFKQNLHELIENIHI